MTDHLSHSGPIGRTILVVDDENKILILLHALLESAGFVVLAADNGPDAVAICSRSVNPIDLLVTDYNMPAMSGLEVARECTRIRSGLPVLYVSGAHPDEELQADLQAGKRAFVAKPFNGDDVIRKARELLAA